MSITKGIIKKISKSHFKKCDFKKFSIRDDGAVTLIIDVSNVFSNNCPASFISECGSDIGQTEKNALGYSILKSNLTMFLEFFSKTSESFYNRINVNDKNFLIIFEDSHMTICFNFFHLYNIFIKQICK